MRRISSLLVAALATTSFVTATAQGVSAAGGAATIKRSTTAAPAAISNATAARGVRLVKTNQTLVVGYDRSTPGSNMYLWKINDDLTIDTAFGAKSLGAESATPSSANSGCVRNNSDYCFNINTIQVNENADTFLFTMNRTLDSGSNSNLFSTVSSYFVGKLSTGQVTATLHSVMGSANLSPATWGGLTVSSPLTAACTSTFGATVATVPLDSVMFNSWATMIRPDGSLVLSARCEYSNLGNGRPSSGNGIEWQATALFGMKASGGSLVLDTTWGTNGVFAPNTDTSKCAWDYPSSSFNTAVTSNSNTATYTVFGMAFYPLSTTIPSFLSYLNLTSYVGCDGGNSLSNQTASYFAVQANGKLKNTTTFPTGTDMFVQRWVIDPQGRWNGIGQVFSPSSQMPVQYFVRLLADGKADTSLGANGMKSLSNLPSSVTVNGTSVSLRYSISGYATTANGVIFSGFTSATTSAGSCTNGVSANDSTTTAYPYYLDIEKGLVTTYGTNGLGEAVTYQNSRNDNCGNSIMRVSYINSKGQHVLMGQFRAVGSQTAGLMSATWDAAEGVTGGGEVGGAGGSVGRVDKKVYSTNLPKVADADSALQVLTAKQAADLDIRTLTPKICVALTTSVLMVNPGRCVVRIIDEDTKKVIRRMSTVVKDTDVDTGTTLTTDEPIYFKKANVTLSKTARAQVAELAAAAKDAARVVIIGHSAALGEVSEYSYAISRNRAEAVRAALVKAGVKVPIEIVAMSYLQPEKTAKSEAAQAKNRRAEVYIFPK